ncbi:MAG: S53 family peptidase [Candidatus Dormibacteria bacterium]|jgi:subtilase family serine protease
MRIVRSWAAVATVSLGVSALAIGTSATALASGSSNRADLAGSLSPALQHSTAEGAVPASNQASFDLVLSLQNAAGAQALEAAVSTPGSAAFHQYLTDAQWEAQYSPSASSVAAAESWLTSEGFKVGAVPADHLFVPASGSVAQVESAFGTTLGYYEVNGQQVQLANSTLSIPSSLSGVVSGVEGVNQSIATADQEPTPPAGYRNPQPCSAYFGQKTDTADSGSLYAPYTSPLPYDICGYTPSQLRSAYGLSAGNTGAGVTVAIVDAYDSPTLFKDTHHYFALNDPSIPLSSSQFINDEPATVDDQTECSGSGWYPEQALDIESVHSMAPKADIVFVGAQDCFDNSLLSAVNTAITSGASVVTDSWGDTLGDLLDDAATKTAYDDTFLLAGGTGVSILFSSGDDGDNFAISGLTAPDYPASSPFVTGVGGTSLEIGSSGQRLAEYGWSTGKQVLCEPLTTTNCGSATTPLGSLAYQVGGGGGTSYYYTEPSYQAPVVPSALALRNENIFGPVPLRVVPDISMDADASTGMLIGLTQTFPNGTYYAQFKEGGTSLASPLLAGVVADADQKAHVSLGFLNPVLYKAYTEYPTAFNDIVAPSSPDSTAVIRVDYADSVDSTDGYVVSLRVITYEGVETYCDGTDNCASRDVTLTTAPGYDSMTGLGSVGSTFIASLSKF